jgi:ankyrin repeat protein
VTSLTIENKDGVRSVLSKGVIRDVDLVVDVGGFTPLYLAARAGHADLVDLLAEHGILPPFTLSLSLFLSLHTAAIIEVHVYHYMRV